MDVEAPCPAEQHILSEFLSTWLAASLAELALTVTQALPLGCACNICTKIFIALRLGKYCLLAEVSSMEVFFHIPRYICILSTKRLN